MLSITRHLGVTLFAVALLVSPAFARTHSLAFHHAVYRHFHHRELSPLRLRREIALRRLRVRRHGERRYYAYAPAHDAVPYRARYTESAFAPASNWSTSDWQTSTRQGWNWQEPRERTAGFAKNFGGRSFFADSAAADWRPSRAAFGASNNSGYRAQGFGAGSPVQSMAEQAASANGVPLSLVDRVIKRESGGNPRAVSRGNYGLMQIRLGTARSMGYCGSAAGLLDPATNMTYAVRYLAGAYRAAGGSESRAVALYARGYNAAPRLQYASYDRERPQEAAFGDDTSYDSFTQRYAAHRMKPYWHRAM
jgi:hypothetical protein